MSIQEELTKLALSCGATKAAYIPAKQIATNRLFRDVCASNGCGMYGKCWMCPPDAGEIEELMAMVHSYMHAVIYQTVTPLEDSFDIEGMGEARKELNRLTRRIRDAVRELPLANALILGAGGCGVCETCTKPAGLPCRNPKEALLSLEACGIDVYQTVKDTPLKYINGQNTVTFFGMVLYT